MVHDFLINESIANIHLTSPPQPTRQPMPVSENEMLTHSLAECGLTLYTTTQPSPAQLANSLICSSALPVYCFSFHSNSEHQWSSNFLSPHHPSKGVVAVRKDWIQSLHCFYIFKQTDIMFLTSQQSFVANNESCNNNVTIKTSIINQGHNNIDKSQPAATRNSESGMGILVECSPDPPAIWQHLYETGPSTELPVLCVRVYSAVQCSTVLYTLYVLYYCGCMYLGWAGTGDLPSWPRVPGVGGPAATRYIYFHYVHTYRVS